jgi:hypothetical protein
MIVDDFDVERIAVFESETKAPRPVYGHGPKRRPPKALKN